MTVEDELGKLKDLLESWEEPSIKRRPKNLTLNMIQQMQIIFVKMYCHGNAKFLNADLVPYLEKCGFTVDRPAGEEINFTVRN